MLLLSNDEIRLELEGKVLVAALKQSVDQGNPDAADFAHKQLFQLLRRRKPLKETTARAERNLYEILGVGQTVAQEIIHKHFLRRVRKLLLRKGAEHPVKFLQTLRSLWIAHDILNDPRTRQNYDLRVLGLPSIIELDVPDLSNEAQLALSGHAEADKIVKLIESSGLLEQKELEIACDMHRAMSEMPFGDFLLKQRFLEPYQLEAILLGGRLINTGAITLLQFKEAMKSLTPSHPQLRDILIEQGYLAYA
jgi:hypothetical protein